MKPIGLVKKRKGWQIVHECTGCGKVQPNIAALHTIQDDFEAIMTLMKSVNWS